MKLKNQAFVFSFFNVYQFLIFFLLYYHETEESSICFLFFIVYQFLIFFFE